MKDGKGLPGAFPPLAGSDYLKNRKDKGIEIPLKGLSGIVKVNGKEYNGVMPQIQLTDDEIANILTYIHNKWGNSGAEVTSSEVGKYRNGK